MTFADDTIADQWQRSRRRMARRVIVITLVLTVASAWFFSAPTWRKLRSRNWPTAPARVERIEQVFADHRAWLIEGTRVRVHFTYVRPDGTTHEAKQEVSKRWAARHDINAAGYFTPRSLRADDRPWELTCAYDPHRTDVALLETTLAHADVPALFPLVVVGFGALLVVAERRNGRRSEDATTRTWSRNLAKWAVGTPHGALVATAKIDFTPDAILFNLLVNWPVVTVEVSPHPLRWGEAVHVALINDGSRRRPRRVRARLMLGPFNTSGRARHARWSRTVFDGRLAAGESCHEVVALPGRADLPAGVEDCWLRVTARTALGLPWSRTLWLAIDRPGASPPADVRPVER